MPTGHLQCKYSEKKHDDYVVTCKLTRGKHFIKDIYIEINKPKFIKLVVESFGCAADVHEYAV